VVKAWRRLNPLAGTTNLSSSISSTSSNLHAAFQSLPSLVLPTDEIIRMSVLLQPMLLASRPILLVGPHGAGKSTLVSHISQLLSNKGYCRPHCHRPPTNLNWVTGITSFQCTCPILPQPRQLKES
jgi:Cdc6-like AAA superfamily ATPase